MLVRWFVLPTIFVNFEFFFSCNFWISRTAKDLDYPEVPTDYSVKTPGNIFSEIRGD